MTVREYYEQYWRESGQLSSEPGPRQAGIFQAWTRRLAGVIGPWMNATDDCVDIGCGDGATSGEWLAGRAAFYVGVDISPPAIEAARARGLNARLIEDASELPFDDESFDLALCSEVLEHLFDPGAAVSEARRVLRPDGRLIITVPNIAHWRVRLDLLFGRWAGRGDARSAAAPWLDPHIRFFTLRSLVRLLETHGFRVVERGGINVLGLLQNVPGLRRLPRQPAAGRVARALARTAPRIGAARAYAVAIRR